MKDYYIGLDVGTDSIGWAVTDTDYNILKFKGNAEWGIRLLEESKTAEERRTHRSARRRGERRKFRAECLEMLFDKEVSKIDPAFFQRMKESNLWTEDKTLGSKYSLFNDREYTDVNYHTDYPTIYHLRKRLIESDEPLDVRLVFLAINHIIKNRGHFIFESDMAGDKKMPSFEEVWNELTAYLNDEAGISLDCSCISDIQRILRDKDLSNTKKKEHLSEKFSVTKKDVRPYAVISLLCGLTVKGDVLFDDEELSDSGAAKITFSGDYDTKALEYEAALGDRFELLLRIKAVYDWAILAEILNDKEYLSFAKCEVYEKHKNDLQLLKFFVKEYIPEEKNRIFNENKAGVNNYLAYSGHSQNGDVEKKCNEQEFLDFLKKELPKECPDEKYSKMYSEIFETGAFLPKIVNEYNSVIPMQVNLAELKAILKNASNYLPFLNEPDEKGKSVSDKIIDIFRFRIPYYVGPLNKHSDKAWIERTGEKIYAWNFSDVVDTEKSAENFIENLTSKCTYIPTEDVLPKNSLLYSKFTVLNEINNLKIDGESITEELKQAIFSDLFMRKKKVTLKDLKNYLKSNGISVDGITGIDNGFKTCMKPAIELAEFNLSNSEKEEIIKTITIFGDDKKLLKRRLKSKFEGKLSEEEILKISKLKFSDWGRLSEKFLNGFRGTDCETGEVDTIIGFMWKTNCNLMQLLSKKFTFSDELEKINFVDENASLKSQIDDLYVSPKVKRPIYQTMQIVEELVKINGCSPKKIFVEVARGEDEVKKRTVSRKDRLIELYKSLKKDNEELYSSLCQRDESEFRRDALYLYYTQMGRCMYTGEIIPLERIFDRKIYNIEHIFPRSKIKDDSLDNRVLVLVEANQLKKKNYPVPQEFRNNMAATWKMLLSKELISRKKYDRLVRNTPLSDEELSSFVQRQLVETRQSTKAIAELLKKRYADSQIVYSKAGLVSEFKNKDKNKNKKGFVKCRELNDFHHAKDAYLNIVVGNVYNTCYTKPHFISDLRVGKASLNKMFDYDTENAWMAKDNKSIDIVWKTMAKNNIRFTRYSYKQKGGLFDQLLLKKGKGQVPIKASGPRSNIKKYGGYNKATATYFAFVSYQNKKGETEKQFVPIDLYIEKEYLSDPKKFIDQKLGVDATVIIPCVKYNTLVSVDGFRMHITKKCSGGKQIGYKSAIQLVLDPYFEGYIKKIANYLNKCAELKCEKKITEFDEITLEDNLKLYGAIQQKLQNTVYRVKFSTMAKTMDEKSNVFESLSLKEQCDVIMQILNILHCNACIGDLSLIDGSKYSGTVTTNSKIAPSKEIKSFKIINQSVTGLFEQERELLD